MSDEVCKKDDCDKTVHARGYCSKHYAWFYRNTTPAYAEYQRAHARRFGRAYRILASQHRAEFLVILRKLELEERRERIADLNRQILRERAT